MKTVPGEPHKMNVSTAFISPPPEEESLIRGVYLNIIFFAFGGDIYLFLHFYGETHSQNQRNDLHPGGGCFWEMCRQNWSNLNLTLLLIP